MIRFFDAFAFSWKNVATGTTHEFRFTKAYLNGTVKNNEEFFAARA